MDQNFFKDQITGSWIVQSTHYSSKKNSSFMRILTNEVRCIKLKEADYYFQLLSLNLNIDFSKNKIELYSIKAKNNTDKIYQQYILIIYNHNKETFILKLNYDFKFINKFSVKFISKQYLSIISRINNLTIIEKIYCLSNNLKVIKTIIKKYNKSIAISFSSEIRIS